MTEYQFISQDIRAKTYTATAREPSIYRLEGAVGGGYGEGGGRRGEGEESEL